MTIIIGHPINGISINGLEYLLDRGGELAKFEDEAQAKQFLRDHGFENDVRYAISVAVLTLVQDVAATSRPGISSKRRYFTNISVAP